jgi:hypothetical protein
MVNVVSILDILPNHPSSKVEQQKCWIILDNIPKFDFVPYCVPLGILNTYRMFSVVVRMKFPKFL